MREANVTCELIGKNFDPYGLEETLNMNLSNKMKRGELAEKGRFKHSPCTYGFGYFVVNGKKDDEMAQVLGLLEILEKKSLEVGTHKIEKINMRIDINYKNQCNMEFDASVLMKLAKKNISLLISCYKINEG